MKFSSQPPPWVGKVLRTVCKAYLVEEIEGDLQEFYRDWLLRYGKRKANQLYVFHALKFLRPYAIKNCFKSQKYNSNLMFSMHLKITFRHLLKHRSYSALNIGGLAVALVVICLISLWIRDELSWNSYHSTLNQVARVLQNQTFEGNDIQTWRSQAKQLAPALRDNFGDHFDEVAMASFPNELTLFIGDRVIKKTGLFMESGAPRLLDLDMVVGSASSLDGFNSIIVSASTAQACFGNADPINQTLRVGNLPEFTVSGVYKDLPNNSSFSNLDFIGSWLLYEKSLPEWLSWGNSWFQCYVKVNENHKVHEVSEVIKDLKFNLMAEDDGKRFGPKLFLHPMNKWHLYSEFKQGENVGGRIQYVRLFGVIAVFVLVLACINFMNLSTARSESRAKEVGIRKAIGSGRKNLIIQFFTESFAISLMAFILALVVASSLMPFFNTLMNKQLIVPWLQPWLWIAGVLIVLVTGILAGGYPALFLSSFKPIRALKGNSLSAKRTSNPRKVLTVIQFTVSVALMIATIFVFRQVQFVKNRSLGYSLDRLIMVPLQSEEIKGDYEIFRRNLLGSGLIEEVSSSASVITSTFVTNSGFQWKGKNPNMQDEFVSIRVDHDFGKSMGWEIIAGRDFSKDLQTDHMAYIINETAAKYMGIEDPVGAKVWRGDEGVYTIVGIAKDMITQSPYDEIRPTIFMMEPERLNYAYIRLKAKADFSRSISTIEEIFQKHEEAYPFEFEWVGDLHEAKFGDEERVGTLSGVFTLLAIIISCMGLYGMSLFVSERRKKEIGVRKVLGAPLLNLWATLSREFVLLTLLSCLLASGLAYYFVLNWLRQFEYHTELSIWVFLASAALAMFIALVTVSYHTIRAATVNPVKSLRSE